MAANAAPNPTNPSSDPDLPRLDWQSGLAPVCDRLAASDVSRVGLQLPEGLRGQSAAVIKFIEGRLGPASEVVLWAEPTFGACDLADRPLAELGAEALIHLGHTAMPCHAGRYAIPVHFVPVAHTGGLVLAEDGLAGLEAIFAGAAAAAAGAKAEAGVLAEAEAAKATGAGAGAMAGTKAADLQEGLGSGRGSGGSGGSGSGRGGGERRLGLVTTAQHAHLLEELAIALKKAGWQSLVGAGSPRLAFSGQILGCNSSAARAVGERAVAGYLYLGTGRFHPLAVALGSRLPVATLDPHTGVVAKVDGERFLRQRFGAIAKAGEADRWAIMVSPQIGQYRPEVAGRVARQLAEAGRSSYYLAATHQAPAQLAGLEVEAAVVTSCPRLAIEEGPVWPIPLLTPPELEIALGLREWDPESTGYPFDEIL